MNFKLNFVDFVDFSADRVSIIRSRFLEGTYSFIRAPALYVRKTISTLIFIFVTGDY